MNFGGGLEAAYRPLSETTFLNLDWESTPLGSVQTWTNPLRFWVRFLLNSAQPTLLIWGCDQTLLFNDAYASRLGSRYIEILGRPFAEVAAPIWDKISAYVEDGYAGGSGIVDDIELPTWRSGFRDIGFYSFAYSPLLPLTGEGPPVGILCLLTDRTEKIVYKMKLAKERDLLHEVYERAPGFIAMTEGADHRFKFANESYRELIGRHDIIGRTVAEVLPEIEQQGFIGLLDQVFQSGVPFVGRAFPIELRSNEGSPPQKRYIDTIYHPVRDAEGAITGLFAEGHDVTEHVAAETLAASLQAQLVRVSRSIAMETFGRAVAHELNQPLAAAVNYVATARKLAERRGGGDDLVQALDRASAATMRAGDILRRMRNFAATGSANAQPLDLVAVVLDAVNLSKMVDPDTCLITTSLENAVVLADSVQVQQVLMNLIRNAQEAMAEVARPEIVISVTRMGSFATISVADRGPGLAKERIPELFVWFVTTKSGGSGIGLPISRQIIEAHSGSMWAENGPAGAVFSFTLPLAEEM